jgi:hypothetical protein
MHAALVGEPGGSGDSRNWRTGFEQSAGPADAVRDEQCVRRQSGAFAEQPDHAELPDACDCGRLIQADVVAVVLGEIVTGQAQRVVVS